MGILERNSPQIRPEISIPLPTGPHETGTTSSEQNSFPIPPPTGARGARNRTFRFDSNKAGPDAGTTTDNISQDSFKKESTEPSGFIPPKSKLKLLTNPFALFKYLRGSLFRFLRNFVFSLREVKKRPVSFFLGFAACCIVVTVISLALTAIAKVPIVFLRLAEVEHGEYDVGLSPKQGLALNYTRISGLLEHDKALTYHSPRIMIYNTPFYSGRCSVPYTDPSSENAWMYDGQCFSRKRPHGCLLEYCDRKSSIGTVFLFDHDREANMGFGRKWKLPRPGPGEAIVRANVASSLGLGVGDTVVVAITNNMDPFGGPLQEVGIVNSTNYYSYVTSGMSITLLPLKVASIFSAPEGKFGSDINAAILVDYATILAHVSKNMNPVISGEARDNLANSVDLYHYAKDVYVNLPPSRLEAYNSNDYDTIQRRVMVFTARVLFFIGYDQVEADFPILKFMDTTRFFSLFLGLIIAMIITVLTILSTVLIYSLLMINIETRSFELGVLRMVGMNRNGLIEIILLQAIIYAVPAWVLGLGLGQVGYYGVSHLIAKTLHVDMAPYLITEAIVLATVLGFSIPILAAILPIRNALTKNLSDALDSNHSKTMAVTYSIERNKERGLPWSSIFVGFAMVVCGFGTYYIFPLSLLSFNLTLLLFMFFALLLAMLLGLVMLSLNLENALEHLITFMFFFWENRAYRALVRKNLIAHRLRNRKTTVMYALSLGFIIFVAVSFQLQIRTLTYQTEQEYGAKYYISSKTRLGLNDPLFLKQVAEYKHPKLKGVGFYTKNLAEYDNTLELPKLSNVGRYRTHDTNIRGVTPNFYRDASDLKFLVVDTEYDSDSGFSLSEKLYTATGSQSIILSTLMREKIGAKEMEKSDVLVTYTYGEPEEVDDIRSRSYKYRVLRPLAFLDASPALSFTRFPTDSALDALVSLPTFVRLSNGFINSVTEISFDRMTISVDPSASPAEVATIMDKFMTLTKSRPLDFHDIEEDLEPFEIANSVMNFFFIFTTVVAMFLCFFSLTASMYTNIQEQSKEIGVLRSLGLKRFTVDKIFVYESFILVIAASFMGIVIGTAVAYAATIQRVLFTQLPLDFVFPYQLIVVVLGLAAICAFVSSFGPVYTMTKRPIVVILRRTLS